MSHCHPTYPPHPCPPCPPPGTLPPAGCPPTAPIPPINIPPCGDTSVWGSISALNERVNQCISQTNGVIAKATQAIACIQQAACENGAYYGPNEVWVEEGYDSNASAKYYVIHKKPCASDGTPIRMELKLAYDNTTNSLLTQDAFEASQMEYAQFMVPAVPVNPNLGWFGHAIWHDAPIPSATLTNAYTAGFTKSGRLRWYDNSVDISQLRRDQIENAMGVYGILVAGGDITDQALRSQIPNADQRTARVCIGQNYDTQEVFILTCGDVDSNGMTSLGCAAVLKQYGCDVAVEVCQGGTCCALDKGQMLYVPDGHNVPAAYAYWYVTKKDSYRTQFVRELAELSQKYGQAIWAANLTYGSVSDIVQDITRLETTVAQHTVDISALKTSGGQSSTAIAAIKATVDLLNARVDTLETTVAQIVQDSGSVGSQLQIINNQISTLQSNLQQEITDRKAAFSALQANLATEISNRTAGDTALQTTINQLTTVVSNNKSDTDADITAIRNNLTIVTQDVATHRANIQTIQSDLSALTDTVTANYNTLNQLVQANTTSIGNHTTQIASLIESMTKLDKAVSDYIVELADIEAALNNIKEVNTTILTQNADLLEKYNNLPSDLTEFTERMQALENSFDEYIATNYTFYLSPTGSDDNDGLSEATPFKTLNRLSQAIGLKNTINISIKFAEGSYPLDAETTIKFSAEFVDLRGPSLSNPYDEPKATIVCEGNIIRLSAASANITALKITNSDGGGVVCFGTSNLYNSRIDTFNATGSTTFNHSTVSNGKLRGSCTLAASHLTELDPISRTALFVLAGSTVPDNIPQTQALVFKDGYVASNV